MSPSVAESAPPAGEVSKRLFDIAVTLVLLMPGLPIMAATALAVRLTDGKPVVFAAPRAGRGRRSFTCWKFRTMAAGVGPEEGVSGGDKAGRITPLGRRLRTLRLDEMPQLLHVLAGEMSLVGPRPPAPGYAARFPEVYDEVLRIRPGVTGLATVMFHLHEESILRASASPAETDALYVRRCIPRKARLDLIYRNNAGIGLDIYVLYLTAGRFLPLPGRRAGRLRARATRERRRQGR
jgi:lipopolysaccharide/colanic/teichoic acid biosynthesis glycosyltransferase